VRELGQVMGLVLGTVEHAAWDLTPGDISEPGDQLGFWFSCAHCNRGYVPRLPAECPRCGQWLRQLVVYEPPVNRFARWLYRKAWGWSLWWIRARSLHRRALSLLTLIYSESGVGNEDRRSL